MRRFDHWTPSYVLNRLALIMYEKRHPDEPWLTKAANGILASFLKATDAGLEFGSGRSTLWFATRVSSLTSVEHDPAYYDLISKRLRNKGIGNVDQRLILRNVPGHGGLDLDYARVIHEFSKESFDFVLVDGIYRDHCALVALEYIKPNGILILDNSNWYLPCESLSPNSRSIQDGPSSPQWHEFLSLTAEWRLVWTSSGVTDTAIYFKPCHKL